MAQAWWDTELSKEWIASDHRPYGLRSIEDAEQIFQRLLNDGEEGVDLEVFDRSLYASVRTQEGRTTRLMLLHEGRWAIEGIAKITIRHSMIEEESILNPYFFGPQAFSAASGISQERGGPKALANVFNSHAEKIAFERIFRAHPGFLVLPNFPIRQLIKLDLIKDGLGDEEYAYLMRGALVDVAVVNADGWCVRAHECQQGPHHDKPEWIWKDAAKRKAFALARIPFDESF
ncbi:MAG: hypothetical protein O9256_00885 [Rhizobiaceae bacterium]|nr:hypothetical protein [Rhizobiaceae bacterium]